MKRTFPLQIRIFTSLVFLLAFIAVPADATGVFSASGQLTVDNSGNITTPALANLGQLQLNGLETPLPPSGRLSLSSSVPVGVSDVTGATAIYYLPYVGQQVPIYNGTHWTEQNIGSSGLTLTLSTTNMPTTEVFDVYVSMQSSSPTLCALYWGGNTSRSTTAGGKSGSQNASIAMLNGIWINNAAIAASNCYNNTTAYTIAQNQGTYLGSFYTTAAGQTGVVFKPAMASGGSANVVGLWNAYNRVKIASVERDSKSSWTYATNAWRASDNSTSNRVTWVDGLQQSFIKCSTKQYNSTSGNGNQNEFGCTLDSTTNGPGAISVVLFGASTFALECYSQENFTPQLGLHYVQMVEDAASGTATMYGNTEQSLMWEGEY